MKYTYFIITIGLILFSPILLAQETVLKENIEKIIKDKKATVGVAIIFDDNTTLTINDGYHFPTMSVYKFYQALAILDYLDKKNLSLDTDIFINKSDLQMDTHSPLRDKYPTGDIKLPIKDLLSYSVSESDNNACDILFNYLGGTEVVDRYIKSLGINDITLQATEQQMNEEIGGDYPNQYLNWTTPSASALIMEGFLREDLFNKIYKDFLKNCLIETSTGSDKLKALIPESTIIGHKTGSSNRNRFGIKAAENDLGFVILPNGKRYTIGVFVMNSREDDNTNKKIIADISKLVYDFYSKE